MFKPKNPGKYFEKALEYEKQKKFDKAEECLKKCLELDDCYTYANNNLSYYLNKQKKFEEGLIYAEKSIKTRKDGRLNPYRNKFDSLYGLKRDKELLEFVKLYPDKFKTDYYRGKIRTAEKRCLKSGKNISVSDKNSTGEELGFDFETALNKPTANKSAGSMTVDEKNTNISLYEHQIEAVKNMTAAISENTSYAGVLVLPTGAGKTLTAAYWLMENVLDKGGKVVWIAHRHELLNQAEKAFEKVCCRKVSKNGSKYNWRIISGKHDKPIHIKASDDIIISSKTSLKRGMEKFVKNWLKPNSDKVFLVIDEAHHAAASEYRAIIDEVKKYCPNYKLLGLTATPFRTAENELGLLKKLFPDDIVYKIDLRELINRGILSEPHFESVKTGEDMTKLFEACGGKEKLDRIVGDKFFDIGSIGNDLANQIFNNRNRNSLIVDHYKNNSEKYGQTIVFAPSVGMAIALNTLFREKGIKSGYVVSDIRDAATSVVRSAKQNEIIINDFRKGKINVIINVNILTEGTDLPETKTVFLTRPTKSTILMTQMIGRALRGTRAGGTKTAYIVSFIDDWKDKIAWVNPEKLFIDTNADFNINNRETQKQILRLISIGKIEEFAKIADETIDERLSSLDFIERIPVGIYNFSYLVKGEDEDDEAKSCNILVYDCMKEAYESLMAWLPDVSEEELESPELADHIDETLFGEKEALLGYNKGDIEDIVNYYSQTGELPKLIDFEERSNYDISLVVKNAVEAGGDIIDFADEEWEKNKDKWSAFFGVNNAKAFRQLVFKERDKQKHPEDYETGFAEPITENELIKIKELPLQEIKERYPELGFKLRDEIFRRYTDDEGFYFSKESGCRSKNKLDFQIDHIIPLSQGGFTEPENLQLLTVKENLIKSDKYSEDL
ncbi:MAG: DEAD/DEAH box helicase family protein [Clostridiales bacterium]|nr:DEAD/DEAH box helicase family protein [Clostridiales bacterium]